MVAASEFHEALHLLSQCVQQNNVTLDSVEVLSEIARVHCLQVYEQQNGDMLEQACREVARLAEQAKVIDSSLRFAQAQDCYEILLRSDYRNEAKDLLHLSVFDG